MAATQALQETEYIEAQVNYLIPKEFEYLIGQSEMKLGPQPGIRASVIHRREATINIPERAFEPGATNAIEKAILAAISYGGHLMPNQTELSAIAGCGKSALKKHLDLLRKKGLVDWESRFHSDGGRAANRYWVCDS